MYKGVEHGTLAVDLDGTLAQKLSDYDYEKHYNVIGKPHSPEGDAFKYVRRELKKGRKVIILTARLNSAESPEKLRDIRKAISEWTKKYLGKSLPSTSEKHPSFTEILDDRAKQVDPKTGNFTLHTVAKRAYRMLSSIDSVQSSR